MLQKRRQAGCGALAPSLRHVAGRQPRYQLNAASVGLNPSSTHIGSSAAKAPMGYRKTCGRGRQRMGGLSGRSSDHCVRCNTDNCSHPAAWLPLWQAAKRKQVTSVRSKKGSAE